MKTKGHQDTAVPSPIGITHVVFRRYKNGGEVVAIFPRMMTDICGRRCGSYTLFRKHQPVGYRTIMAKTKPATPAEYRYLASHLVAIGYDLVVLTRTPAQLHRDRILETILELFG